MVRLKKIHSIAGHTEEEIVNKTGSLIIEKDNFNTWKHVITQYGIDKKCVIIIKNKKTDSNNIAYSYISLDRQKVPDVIVLKTLRKDIIDDAFDFLYYNFGFRWKDKKNVLRTYLAHVYLHECYEIKEARNNLKHKKFDGTFDFMAFKKLRKSLDEEMIMKICLFHLAIDKIQ